MSSSKEIIKTEHFDLVHNVGPIGYREPGYLWKLGLPYIWGPVGGANNAPLQLMKHMPLIGRMKQTFRNVANIIQFHTKHRLKLALKATDVLLTATSENQRKFKKVYHKDSIYFPENCITGEITLDESKFDNPSKYNIIAIGTLDSRKSIGIFLESLVQVYNRDMLHVDIVGDGPLRDNLQRFAKENGLDKLITWYGQLPRVKAVKVFNSAHLHVITSVSEGNPTTIWEAMSYGVPTMSFDHCGMHDTICDRCGIRVPIAKRYEDCVADIARNIDELLEHPERFHQLAHGVLECAKRYTWNEREKFLNEEIYVKETGYNLSVGKGCYLDALSTDGISFGDNVSIGKYTCIECSGTLKDLGKGLVVGNNVGLGTHGFLGCAGGVSIGDNTIFGNYVSIHSENHNYEDRNTPIRLQGVNRKGIKIGRDCWIGAKATILDGADIGDGCIVAAGAVVRGKIPPYSIIGGVPAKFIKER